MPKASVAALVVDAISPKLHDKTLSAFVVPDGKPPETMSKSGPGSRRPRNLAAKRNERIAFLITIDDVELLAEG